mmetsp:Transcript_6889/g.17081  ORF Transcript_6889/g.17081 Transcript_6889/m.17081 type:complete len:241 (+) Transcript_6889:188-910(+)
MPPVPMLLLLLPPPLLPLKAGLTLLSWAVSGMIESVRQEGAFDRTPDWCINAAKWLAVISASLSPIEITDTSRFEPRSACHGTLGKASPISCSSSRPSSTPHPVANAADALPVASLPNSTCEVDGVKLGELLADRSPSRRLLGKDLAGTTRYKSSTQPRASSMAMVFQHVSSPWLSTNARLAAGLLGSGRLYNFCPYKTEIGGLAPCPRMYGLSCGSHFFVVLWTQPSTALVTMQTTPRL